MSFNNLKRKLFYANNDSQKLKEKKKENHDFLLFSKTLCNITRLFVFVH